MQEAQEVDGYIESLWHVPAILPSFTGRVEQLEKLRGLFNTSGMRMVIRHAPQITGTGGIGKTQLAVQFVHEIHRKQLFNIVIWLNADCTLRDQLNTEFLLLARRLRIDTQGIDKKALVENVYNELGKYLKVFIVFDSASSYATLEPYLPPAHQDSFNVLVTTRDDQVWSEQFAQLPLDIFSVEEALEYIKKVLPDHLYNEQDATELADCLGRFPLGLAQATGYIVTRNVAIQEYLRFYRDKLQVRQKLLDMKPVQADPHLATIWVTVQLCLEQIRDELALKILPASAFLSAESPIDREIFSYYSDDSLLLQSAIDLLRKFSLLENTQESGRVRIHQLVQEIVLLTQKQPTLEENLETIVRSAYKFFNRSSELLATEQRQLQLIPHFVRLLSHLTARADQAQVSIAKLSGCLGICFHRLGQFDTMLGYCEVAHAIFEKTGDHEQEGALLTNIGNAYGGLGKSNQHQEYLEKALVVFRKVYAEDHEQILITLGNLACVYGEHGEAERQKTLLEQILQIEETKYGKNSGQVAKTLNNLSCALGDLGRYEEMRKMCERALAIDEVVYGKEHPETAVTLVNLGSALNDLEDYPLAILHLRRAIAIDEKHFGSDHIKLADALQNIAFSYQSVGNNKEAQQCAARSLAIKEKNLGENHHRLSTSLVVLAGLAAQSQSFHEQIRYLDRAWKINRLFYGDRHPKTLNVLGTLAISYESVGQNAKKIELLNLLLELTKQEFGDNHILVAKTYTNLAVSYGEIPDRVNEKKYLSLALEVSRAVLGDVHPEVAIAINNLAAYYLSVGDANQAVVSLKQALAIFRETLGDQHQYTLLVQQNLLRLTQQVHRGLNPLEIIEQFDPSSKFTRQSVLALANAAMAVDHYESAIQLLCYLNEQSGEGVEENQKLLARYYLAMGDLDMASACVIDYPESETHKQIGIEINKKKALEMQLQTMKEPQNPDAGFFLQKSRRYIAMRQYPAAIQLLQQALRSNPQEEQKNASLMLLAQCYYYIKDYNEALKCIVTFRTDEAQALRGKINQAERANKKLEIILGNLEAKKVFDV